jgi:hypothetical protein
VARFICLILCKNKVPNRQLWLFERLRIDDSTDPGKVSLVCAVVRGEADSILKINDTPDVCRVLSESRILKSHSNLLILRIDYGPTTLRGIILEGASVDCQASSEIGL